MVSVVAPSSEVEQSTHWPKFEGLNRASIGIKIKDRCCIILQYF